MIERIFGELVDLSPDQQALRLRDLAAKHPEQAREVASLLAAAGRAGDFLGLLAGGHSTAGAELVAGRYRTERRVGGGAMGEVYLARDLQLDRPVALKFLHAPSRSDPTAVSRFIGEARAAARLNHPHVATVYDIGEAESGRLFIAMAYYAGATLRDRIAHGPLAFADALRIAEEIASALAAAHAAGIVHRDVKPPNVLFDVDGEVKLADFGIAKLPGHDATDPDAVVGTIAYMAPEQAKGSLIDARVDLWALGVVLFEMLTGRRPLEGNGAAIVRQLVSDDPSWRPFDELAVAAEVRPVLARLLATNPDDRYADGAAARDALSTVRRSVDAHVPSRAVRAAPAAGRPVPRPLTSFIGREREVTRVLSLLESARLITLTGVGGTGKTRLAIRIGEEAQARFPGGVYFVPLAGVQSAEAVPATVAAAVGARHAGPGSAVESIVAVLGDARLLLIIDNFEHVADAAPFVAELLQACPGLTVLATSRAPLHVQGEREVRVPPLGLPGSTRSEGSATAASFADAEAVRLFVDRARAADPDFALAEANAEAVAEICRRLDGLPLAIELAAARAKLLSPRAILTRLGERLDFLRTEARDVPARHRTLRAAIDWSHGLLTGEQRVLYRRLAVFSGGFTLVAARAVMQDARAIDVLDAVASLCDESLVRQEAGADDEPRFSMLETVREHALGLLRSAGEESTVRRAHLAWCLELVEEAEAHLRGPAQRAWLDRLDVERHNLHAALAWAIATAGTEHAGHAARLGAALHRYWVTRGHAADGARRLAQVIARLDADDAEGPGSIGVSPVLRGKLLAAAAVLETESGSFLRAREHLERSLAAYRRCAHQPGIATTLNHLGWTSWITGDIPAARALSEEALAMHRRLDDALGAAIAMNNLAWIALTLGRYAEAEEHFEAALALHRQRGDIRSTAFMVSNLGMLATLRGELYRAVSQIGEALALLEPVSDPVFHADWLARLTLALHLRGDPGDHAAVLEARCVRPLRELGQPSLLGFTLARLAVVHRDRGALAAARACCEESVRLRRQIHDRVALSEPLVLLADVLRLQKDLSGARTAAREALQVSRSIGAPPDMVAAVTTLALIAMDEGRPELAATLLAAAEGERERLGIALPPGEARRIREAYERIGLEARDRSTRLGLDAAAAMALDERKDP